MQHFQPGGDNREIRVFISSTFRDMRKEREELVKRTFPQLRRLCEVRSVTWGEVDLRWGSRMISAPKQWKDGCFRPVWRKSTAVVHISLAF
jgi:hypothetical protein